MRRFSPEQAERKAWLVAEAQTRALNDSELDNLLWLCDPDDPDFADCISFVLPPDERPKKKGRGSTATEAQTRANRENAQKSTGPKSPEGKARSSLNAITHGLTARDMVTFGESAEEFDAFRGRWMAELAPEGVEEETLANRVAQSDWLLRRAGRMEKRFTWLYYVNRYSAEHKLDGLDAEARLSLSDNVSALLLGTERFISNLDRHEAHIERGYYRAMRELKKLQAERSEDGGGRTERRRRRTDDGRPTREEGRQRKAEGKADGDCARRSQFGAETPVAPAQAEALRARAAQEAAKFRSAVSGGRAGACGDEMRDAERPGHGLTPQSCATGGEAENGDFAKRSQFGAAPAGGEAESASQLAGNGPA